jgi:hypothetical protein
MTIVEVEEKEDEVEEEEEEEEDAGLDRSRGYHLRGNGQAAREEDRSSDVITHDGSDGVS